MKVAIKRIDGVYFSCNGEEVCISDGGYGSVFLMADKNNVQKVIQFFSALIEEEDANNKKPNGYEGLSQSTNKGEQE
jgi:hypothetical protein